MRWWCCCRNCGWGRGERGGVSAAGAAAVVRLGASVRGGGTCVLIFVASGCVCLCVFVFCVCVCVNVWVTCTHMQERVFLCQWMQVREGVEGGRG